ncbi:MAG: VWA domain-containing protein [Deltaproteobacteria bacterium]|nr:VWA domain-containing protein [Deltaproteobacteria bacterium]
MVLAVLFLISCGKKSDLSDQSDTSDKPEQTTQPVARAVQQVPSPTLEAAGQSDLSDKSDVSDQNQVPAVTQLPGTPSASAEATAGKPEGVQSLAAPAIPPPTETPAIEPKPVAATPKLLESQSNINILIDASGSMSAPFSTTATDKFSLLRTSVLDVLASVTAPTDTPRNVGLRVFGSTSPTTENNCEDTENIAPIGEPSGATFQKGLDPITAKGMSPLAATLRAAEGDFPVVSQADRIIVLVADGADNCNEDPCVVAGGFERATQKTTVHVVGFDVTTEDEAKLRCIADTTGGRFFLARTENELRASLDEAINASVPYNLKLIVTAGSVPLPTELTIFKAGTQSVVRRDKSFGTKFLKLEPGTYDVLVEFTDSAETKRPSKIVKGVEVLAETKIEQTLTFELGAIALSAIDDDNKNISARYQLIPVGGMGATATVSGEAGVTTTFVTPGQYDVVATRTGEGADQPELTEKGIAVTTGEAKTLTFRFQRGFIAVTGKTTQKTAIPFSFQVFRAGKEEPIVASGAFPTDGGSIPLTPGTYDLLLIGQDPAMPVNPRTKATNVIVKAAETTPLEVQFEMGMVRLSARDGEKKPLAADFVIRDQKTQDEIARTSYEGGKPKELSVPPGTYDVIAELQKIEVGPKPTVPLPGVVVTADKPTETIATFNLGKLRLRSRDSKENAITSTFTVYTAGTDRMILESPATADWIAFDIAPGHYDIKADNMSVTPAEGKERVTLWLRDIPVEDAKTVSHEAIFTAGRIRLIGRTANNRIITCKFKIFQYGADRELINGTTSDDWVTYEINPGKYYLEASYLDPEGPQLLKKWITVNIGDNQIVEQVLRF